MEIDGIVEGADADEVPEEALFVSSSVSSDQRLRFLIAVLPADLDMLLVRREVSLLSRAVSVAVAAGCEILDSILGGAEDCSSAFFNFASCQAFKRSRRFRISSSVEVEVVGTEALEATAAVCSIDFFSVTSFTSVVALLDDFWLSRSRWERLSGEREFERFRRVGGDGDLL